MPFAQVGDASIYYEEQGSGEPLLLLPGLGLDHNYYRLLTPLLTHRFTLVSVDPRGIGQSTKSPPPYTVERWADDYAQMIRVLGAGPVHVLGSSLGGATALMMAADHPGEVRSITVVGGFAELDRATQLNFDLRARLIEKLGMGQEVADYMALWTLTRDFINSDAGYAQMLANQKIIRSHEPEMYLDFVKSVLRLGRCLPGQENEPKFTGRLSGIDTPALILSSDHDNLIPLESSQLIAREMPNAKLVVLRDAGHIPCLEKPQEVAEQLIRFVDGLPGERKRA